MSPPIRGKSDHSRTSTITRALAFFLFLFSATSAIYGAEAIPEPIEFRIALIAEPGETPCVGSESDAQGCEYVRWMVANSDLSVGSSIKLVIGNHWEITDWLRRREVDAAIVSAVSDYALRRISGIEAKVELPSEKADGKSFDSEGVIPGYVRGSKAIGLDDLFAQIDCEQDCKQSTTFVEAPSQLSSARFVFPLIVARAWFNRTHRCRDDDGSCQQLIERRKRFWTKLLAQIKFRTPSDEPGDKCFIDETRITFTSRHVGCNQDRVTDYRRSDLPDSAFPTRVPFDRLLVWSDRVGTGIKFLPDSRDKQRFIGEHGYSNVTAPKKTGVREAFEQMLEELRKEPSLDYRMANWYDEGIFTFTIDDLMAELRRQQAKDKKSLALTLSGGGVKSVFQSVVLDYLYTKGRLFNARERLNSSDPAQAVAVSPIIGTSGGALNGLLTWLVYDTPRPFAEERVAQQDSPLPSGSDRKLTRNWVSIAKDGTATSNISEADIFPFFSVLRYLSFIVSFSIILIVLRVTSPARSVRKKFVSAVSKAGFTITLAIVIAVPLLVWLKSTPSLNPENGRAYVALLVSAYFCLVLLLKNKVRAATGRFSWWLVVTDATVLAGGTYLLYLSSASVVCSMAPEPVCKAVQSPDHHVLVALCSFGAALYLFAVIRWLWTSIRSDGRDWRSAITMRLILGAAAIAICAWLTYSALVDPIVCAGLLLVWSLLIAAYCDRSHHASRTRFGNCRPHIVLICLVVLGTFLTARLVWLITFTGRITQFEFSSGYWLALAVCAGAIGSLFSAIIRFLRGSDPGLRRYIYRNFSRLDRELSYISQDWSIRPASVFLSLTLLGWGLWAALPVQSLYGGDVAFRKVRQAVKSANVSPTSSQRASLVLVESVLGDTQAEMPVAPKGASSICPIHDQMLVTIDPNGQRPVSDEIKGEKLVLAGPLGVPNNNDVNACGELHADKQNNTLTTIDRLICAATASGSPFPIFPATPKSLPSGYGCKEKADLVDGGYSANQPRSVARELNASMILSIEATPECRSREHVGSMFSTLTILLGYLWDRSQLPDHSAMTGALVASILPPNDVEHCEHPVFLMDFRAVTVSRLFNDAERLLKESADIGVIRAWPAPHLVSVKTLRAVSDDAPKVGGAG